MESVLIVCFLLALLAAVVAHSVSCFVMFGCVSDVIRLGDSRDASDAAFGHIRRLAFFGRFSSVAWLVLDLSPFLTETLPVIVEPCFIRGPMGFVFFDVIFLIPYFVGTVSFFVFVCLMRNCLEELSDADARSERGHVDAVFPKGTIVAVVVFSVCAIAMLVAIGVLWHNLGFVLPVMDFSSGSYIEPMEPPPPYTGW